MSLFTILLLVLCSALIGGISAYKLKLPSLVGYILAGVIIGNLFPSYAQNPILKTISDSGVTLLLFTLGIEFSFHRLSSMIKSVGKIALLQVCISIGVFFLFSILLHIPPLASLVIASACALSSTAIVVKTLSEKGELETVPGEVSTGWLVIQDLSVIFILIFLPMIVTIAQHSAVGILSLVSTVLFAFSKVAIVLVSIFFLGKIIIPKFLSAVTAIGSRELFLVSTIGIVFLASVGTYAVGLSAPMGAFIAGLIISETSQNHAVFSEIRPLRDLFAVVFFTTIGMMLPISIVGSVWQTLLALTIGVLCIKWVIVYVLGRIHGFHKKTAFLVAVALLPMSEFGFILAAVGVSLGVLTNTESVLLVALTFTTIVISSPFISSGQKLYSLYRKTFGAWFPTIFPQEHEAHEDGGLAIEHHIVICGFGRVGMYVGRALELCGIPFVVIDYNHHKVMELRQRGIEVVYGDPADIDVLDYAQVDKARAIIIAIPDRHTQEMVIGNAVTLNKKIKIYCRSHHEEDQRRLKSLGVHTIIQPEFEASLSITQKILLDAHVPGEDISAKITRLKIEHGLG